MRCLALTVIATLTSCICSASASDATGALSLERLVQDHAPAAPNLEPVPGQHLVMANLPSQHVRAVKSTTDAGGFHQIVEFDRGAAGLPANMIDIRYRRTMTDDDAAIMQRPTESGIRDELVTRFSGIDMVIVAHPRSNAYGVYGLAVGKAANGASCIYAWQWADTSETQKAADSFDALSLRISLCRTGITLDALAADIDRLRVGPTRMTVASRVKRPSRLASAHRASQRVVASARRPMPAPASLIQNSPPPVMLPVESKVAAIDPSLDPSLPAAAYQGPTAPTRLQRVGH